MSEQPNEVHSAASETIRTFILTGTQVAELTASQKLRAAQEATAASEQQARLLGDQYQGQLDAAKPAMRQAWNARWWNDASPQQIGSVWQITAEWAGCGEPWGVMTLAEMRRQLSEQFGIQVPDVPVAGHEVVTLLAAGRDARGLRAEAARVARDERSTEAPAEPYVEPEADGPGATPAGPAATTYRYVIRSTQDPDQVAAQGTLRMAGADSARDAAIAGLRDYARGGTETAQSSAARMARLYGVAFGRPGPGRDVSGLRIDIYTQDGGRLLTSLCAEDVPAARAELRAAHERVIDGSERVSNDELATALALEIRATGDEVRERQARLTAGVERVEEPEGVGAELAAQRERLRQLEWQRELVGSDRFDEARLLLGHLDVVWWHDASAPEVAAVWDHVAAWSPDGPQGRARAVMQSTLRRQIAATYDCVVPEDATGQQVRELVGRALDVTEPDSGRLPGTARSDRAHEEHAAARDAAAREDRDAERLATRARLEDADAAGSERAAEGRRAGGGDQRRAAADGVHAAAAHAAARQDDEAAAALETVSDREAAEAVVVAAQGFADTPSGRLNASRGSEAASRPAPHQAPTRERDQGR
jgi:hypothetical protein